MLELETVLIRRVVGSGQGNPGIHIPGSDIKINDRGRNKSDLDDGKAGTREALRKPPVKEFGAPAMIMTDRDLGLAFPDQCGAEALADGESHLFGQFLAGFAADIVFTKNMGRDHD